MASAQIRDRAGKKVGERELKPDLFEAPISVPLMHQAVVAGKAAVRSGTRATKTRAQVSGGGKKPWRQKGTGRARAGSSRMPQWKGGGVAHGPQPQNFEQRLNKKMRRAALNSALSDSLASGKLAVIDELSFDAPKTKDARAVVDALELGGKILLVLEAPNENIEKSFNNLPDVRVSYARSIAVYELISADRVLLTSAALDVVEGVKAE